MKGQWDSAEDGRALGDRIAALEALSADEDTKLSDIEQRAFALWWKQHGVTYEARN